jgi:hypothetical protein
MSELGTFETYLIKKGIKSTHISNNKKLACALNNQLLSFEMLCY